MVFSLITSKKARRVVETEVGLSRSDEGDEMFGGAIDYFKSNNLAQILRNIVDQNRGKKGVFNGVDEISFFFEWYGPKSFAGFHSPGDTLRLAIIDVFLKKKGYLEPGVYWKLFKDSGIEVPDLIYRGKLTRDFVKEIQENDWMREDSKYPNVKEGVVVKRSTLLKGQRLLKTKIKTSWWLSELQKNILLKNVNFLNKKKYTLEILLSKVFYLSTRNLPAIQIQI